MAAESRQRLDVAVKVARRSAHVRNILRIATEFQSSRNSGDLQSKIFEYFRKLIRQDKKSGGCWILWTQPSRQSSEICPTDVSLRVERRDAVAASSKAGAGTDSIDIGSMAGASVTGCSIGHFSGS